jgi:hypothetical protein
MKKAMTNSYPGDVGLTPTVKAIQSRKGSNSMLAERDQRIEDLTKELDRLRQNSTGH